MPYISVSGREIGSDITDLIQPMSNSRGRVKITGGV